MKISSTNQFLQIHNSRHSRSYWINCVHAKEVYVDKNFLVKYCRFELERNFQVFNLLVDF